MFALDPAFAATAHALGDLPLCHARLQDDARYPWIVLIPRIAHAEELEELSSDERVRLLDEIMLARAAVRAVAEALGHPTLKLNLGQLGNVTRQLHVHLVARHPGDPAWPGPVWGHSPAEPYDEHALKTALDVARAALRLRA